MADSVERLKKIRAPLKSVTTKLMQKLEGELKKSKIDCSILDELLNNLCLKEASLKELDNAIANSINIEELDAEAGSAQEYQEKIITIKYKVTKELQRKDDSVRTPETISQPRIEANCAVKLPLLSISKFNGDPMCWQSFWEQFDSAIHQNSSLSKVDKFNYLLSFLEGSAADAVNGFALTNDNYDSVVEVLTKRYGRKDLIVSAHMNKLLSLQPVRKTSDVTGLRFLYDKCENNVRSLAALGVTHSSYGSLLCPMLLKMLPEELTLEYSRRKSSDQLWDVKEILDFLKTEVESRERAIFLTKVNSNVPSNQISNDGNKSTGNLQQKKPKHSNDKLSTATALSTGINYKCIFCDQASEHSPENCKALSVKERKEKVLRERRCFICLGLKHSARFCKKWKNRCISCGKRHHISICDEGEGSKDEITQPAVLSSVLPVENNTSGGSTVFLQTAEVKVKGVNSSILVKCLFDGGSQRTFIREDLSRALDLPIVGTEKLTIHTFGTSVPIKANMKKVQVSLQSSTDARQCIQIEALEIPELCNSVVRVPGTEIREIMKGKGLQLADNGLMSSDQDQRASILIGADNFWKIVSGNVQRLKGSLMAIETLFGWCIQGQDDTESDCLSIEVMKVTVEEDLISQRLRAFWEIESLGIIEPVNYKLTKEEEDVMQFFESSIKFDENRYTVSLPWKNDRKCLGNNFEIAKRRLTGLAKKFESDPDFYHQYRDVLREQEENGIIEKVENDMQSNAKASYYLPHRAVVRENHESTKLRIVFDASSHTNGSLSLNECLAAGPNLNPDLLAMLLKFRNNNIAFIGDIEKAFLQIYISEDDRNFVKFLWCPNFDNDNKNLRIETWRMNRVLFGVTSSPFLLAATIKYHLKKYQGELPEVHDMLNEDLYVDDLISGADSVEEAVELSSKAREILGAAGMYLRKWKSNSTELREIWNESGFEDDLKITKSGETVKVLGLSWDITTDEFKFDLEDILKFSENKVNTKRFVLQVLSRIYDPLGYLSPFSIRAKCMLQEIWKRGLTWDQELPVALLNNCEQWISELIILQEFRIPRCLCMRNRRAIISVQLHGFSDASELAYGAVIYARFETIEGNIQSSFVISKTRVAPVKRITLPRLELMGALLAARLINYVKGILKYPIVSIHLWSDSSIVLHWIRGPSSNWKQFVANRVSEIQCLTEPNSWSHCPGKDNPADLVTRGKSAVELLNNKTWFNGPLWLNNERDSWPSSNSMELDMQDELFTSEAKMSVLVNLSDQQPSTTDLLDLNKINKLKKILRITAWIKRFVNNSGRGTERKSGPLSAEEIVEAEKYWIRTIQSTEFHEEITRLKERKPIFKISRIANLNPVLDSDGLICVGSRLNKSNLTTRQVNPWIMPSKHKFTELEIQQCHEQVFHQGLRDTIIQIRERFWILKGRQATKALINRCFVCKKLRVTPATEVFAPLPADRISETPPFETIGIDFAGPLYVKTTAKKSDYQLKAYILLITCAVTRAIHLELVSSLSTQHFLLAFKRFVARRGLCKTIYSDNAKTFQRASKDFENYWNLLKGEEIVNYFSDHRIKWKFIVERGPWQGGFYERLVRSVKSCLKRVLGKALLCFEELTTVLAECEAVLNSRPLSYLYNEASELEPITPSHFLIGKRLTTLPSHREPAIQTTNLKREDLTKRIKYKERLLNNLWKRWRNEYLLELRTAHYCPPRASHNLKIGDVILVKDEKLPRQMWRLGKIQENFQGRDGKVRSCLIRIGNGKEIRRPVQFLFPLEINQAEENKEKIKRS